LRLIRLQLISDLGSIAWTIALANYGAGGAGAWQV
jgi:hypothetical protein